MERHSIDRMYDRFFAKTGDPVAAATLTLAQVQSAATLRQPESLALSAAPAALNPSDVAKQLRVSPAKVIGWIRTGQLKAANVSTGQRPRFVIQQPDVDRFLQGRQPDPPAPRRRSGRGQAPDDRY